MRVFVAVVDAGSFVGASKALGLSAPSVTRTIARLEDHLGVRLFNRTTRLVRLTDAGQRYAIAARSIAESIADAEAAAAGTVAEPTGTLTIAAPVLFGQYFVIPIVTEYLKLHADVSVRTVFFDRVSNLLEEGIDVAIRIGQLNDSTMYGRAVGKIRKVVCASPGYIAAQGAPTVPADLANHSIIQATAVEPSATWHFGSDSEEKVEVSARLQCTQNSAAIKAAILGGGLTRVMSYQVASEVSSGALQVVLEDFEPRALPLNIVHLEGRQGSAKIRTFVSFASEQLRNHPDLATAA